MAATSGQSRWRLQNGSSKDNLSHRITRSARALGRSTFNTNPNLVMALNEDLRNAVSPHWKRVSGAGSVSPDRAQNLDDVKVRRRALLVSDFRFVSRSRADGSAHLESDFERFATSYGDNKRGGSIARLTDFSVQGESSQRTRDRRKEVRFVEEEQQPHWDIGMSDDIQNDPSSANAGHWTSSIPTCESRHMYGPQTMIPTTLSSSSYNGHTSSLDPDAWRMEWWRGDNNSLYEGIVDATRASEEQTGDEDYQNDDIIAKPSDQVMHADSAAFIEKLTISDPKTRNQAINRLLDVERHISHSREIPIISSRDRLSFQDEQLLDDTAERAPKLLSASLDTASNQAGSGTSFFYCPYLSCHHRLINQSTWLTLSWSERRCVHTNCNYTSHDVQGWVDHCIEPHHEYASARHDYDESVMLQQ